MPDSRAVLNEYGFRGMSKVKSHAHLWDPFLRTPESAPHKIPWPIDSPSQEMRRGSSKLYLDRGREHQILGHREEAQTWSRMMMIIHLHESEGYLPSRILQRILELPRERARMI